MPIRENISYLVPRDPSITSWSERVKLPGPSTKNLVQLGLEEMDLELTMGESLKVYLRLKPFTSPNNPYSVVNSTTLQTEAPKESVSFKNVSNGIGKLIHKFTFTSVLDQDTTQAELFEKCAVKSIKKFLSGENHLLMAYGTTSGGKTFTMQGNVEQPGVIPRALDFVFSALKGRIIPFCSYHPYQYNELLMLGEEQMRKDLDHKNFILSLDLTRYPDTTMYTTLSSGLSCDNYVNVTFREMQSNLRVTESFELNSTSCKYSVWVSMIEIYNEQVYDLLETPNSKGMRPKLAFKEDECGNTFVKNLRYVNVSSGHEAFQILEFGRKNLHMAPTALNERSSRSHCIFMITLAKFPDYELSSEAVVSRFSFCDLAGMERAKKTLNVKDRLVESKSINTSLSILVKCLVTIKENQNNKEKKMIPYRESKLTKLFRDAVMGKEQFSLIVNVTSEPNLFDETLNVLKFSSIAQKIVPQNVFVKPKIRNVVKKSRFSRIVTNAGSNSRIIDWEASAVADLKLKKEESSCSSQVEDLQDLVDRLREELAREKERCQKIEEETREELTSNFSQILKKMTESHNTRIENQSERLQEMYERKQKRIINYYEALRKKRRKMEDEDLEDYADQAERLKELEDELSSVKSENEALKQRVQDLVEQTEKVVCESTELKFKLVEKNRLLEAMQKTNEANEVGGDALVTELRKQLEEANTKITNFKSLLQEAACDNKELEENNKYLRNENEVLEEQLTEHADKVADLKNEVADLQNLLSQKRIMIERLEEANEKMTEDERPSFCEELLALRDQLKATSEKLSESREELEAEREARSSLEKDLEICTLKVADLQSKVLSLETNYEREEETQKKMAELEEEVESLKAIKAEAEVLAQNKQILEERCNEFNSEIKILQKELKDLVSSSRKESERLAEVDTLTKENENIRKELLKMKKKNEELEEELKEQIDNLKTRERESKIALESLSSKLEAVEYQNSVMKNLKDEAERQAYEVPQLRYEITRLEKEIENREKDLTSFNENRQLIFNNYEKEVVKLKEENERLRKDVLFANEIIAKNMTPLKTDKAEISRLKESVKKKDEEINKLKAVVDSVKKSESGEESLGKKLVVSDSSSADSPFVNIKNKKKDKRECTPEGLTKQMETLTLKPEAKSTRKKVDLLEETIHPSTVKTSNRGKRRNVKKEKETEKQIESEKENIPVKKSSKCHKQLFSENDFEGLSDLNASPLEQEIPRLRPRK